jgi:hypothetical protein
MKKPQRYNIYSFQNIFFLFDDPFKGGGEDLVNKKGGGRMGKKQGLNLIYIQTLHKLTIVNKYIKISPNTNDY